MKPSIIVKTYEPDPLALREILAGIEEEGILYTLLEEDKDLDCYGLARESANLSKLQVGIGLRGNLSALCVHKTRDILLFDTDKDFRLIGQNGSRYVKGNPFITY